MSGQNFLDGRATLLAGDCLEILAALPEASVDSVVTDPPYELGFMSKRWDSTGIANRADLWALVLRVLRPGGHLLAFSGTRTYHRMACAIEDAGFEIRDQIGWAYGSGFPKSHSVDKAIDKALGASGTFGAPKSAAHAEMAARGQARRGEKHEGWDRPWMDDPEAIARANAIYEAGSDEGKQWQGWGTALKPAWEPICLARKPLIGTVAANVLEHGVGALNIDGCRVATEAGFKEYVMKTARPNTQGASIGNEIYGDLGKGVTNVSDLGRWPANIIHDGSEDVVGAFPDSDGAQGDVRGTEPSNPLGGTVYYDMHGRVPQAARLDSGSAARFFYTAKADAEDRLGSKHPTVKPLDLMQWLVRLVTPKGGMVLDPFAGTGTTGEAAWREGCRAILIEREAEYQADIARRMELAVKPTKRAAVAKTKNQLEDPNDLPLFREPAE